MSLPVCVSDQRQAAVVPRHLPQDGKDEEQDLKKRTSCYDVIRGQTSAALSEHVHCVTHQEAHEVECEHGGHAPKRQPLQHRAADPGGVTVVFRPAVGGAVVPAAARLATTKYRHGNDQHFEHAHCHILAVRLWKETDFS